MLRKIPAALVIVAIIIAGVGYALHRDSDDRTAGPLSNPARGALVSTGIKSPEEQVTFWQARVDANPTDYMSRASLGSSMLALAKTTGDLELYEAAEAVFTEALGQNPKHPGSLLGLGAARGAQHDFATQLELAERVYADHPENSSAYVTIADARFELGQYDAAAAIYEKVAAQERSAAMVSRLAKAAWYLGERDAAVELSREAISASSELELRADEAAYYWFQLGTYAYRVGDIDAARDAVDRAIEIDPENLGALELAPRIRIAQRDIGAAISLYEELVAKSPAADLHGELAKLYEVTGRHDEATHQVELGLSLGREQVGRFPAERRHLADFFGTYDPALALRLAEEDIATRQDVGGFDTLAWSLYQNGRFEEARRAAQNAMASGIVDVPILFHAGMIEAELGNRVGARSLLLQALDINPHFDVIDARIAHDTLESLA